LAEVTFLERLEDIVRDRLKADASESYTARLGSQGITKVAQKLGEEAVELALAAAVEHDARVVEEAADLLYHMIVTLSLRGIPLSAVMRELSERHQQMTS
jgi:phosphoribosyl-ATP pyrophosphohydrolase